MKVSHEDADEVTKIIKWLRTNAKTKEIGVMKATRGKVHKHLGITLDFEKKGSVKIKMTDHIESMVKDFTGKLKEKATTPAA